MKTEVAYGYTRELPGVSPEEAIERTTAALQTEGFGVLTRIDVQKTLKEKLGVDGRPYVILGACNPKLAHEALSAEPGVGLLLPCNVTVFERPAGGSVVQAVKPRAMFEVVKNPALGPLVDQVDEKLRRVLERI
ncbi:MAG: DUF302 domain-containing protein [Deltaproteobacteria bacterium]